MNRAIVALGLVAVGFGGFAAGKFVEEKSVGDAVNTCLLSSAVADINMLSRFSLLLSEGRSSDVANALPKVIDTRTSVLASGLGPDSAVGEEARLALTQAREAKRRMILPTDAIDMLLARK
jgi:hypothetical protein